MTDARIEAVLRRWGLNHTYQGYPCLICALRLIEQDPEQLDLVTKCIYPSVARQCGLSISRVDSSIRAAMAACRRRNPAEVARFCGSGGELTVSRFLSGLHRCIQLSDGGRQ